MPYRIPKNLEEELKKKYRGKKCVFCRRVMRDYPHRGGYVGDRATIEHLHYNGPDNWGEIKNGIKLSKENLVMCCARCNSAERKDKKLLKWFREEYCTENKICEKNITDKIVRKFLKRYPNK